MKIPFTPQQFFQVLEEYNHSVFPMQIIIFLFVIVALILFARKSPKSNIIIAILLGFLWLWSGIVYHLCFFTSINKAAYGFGGLFIIEGLLLFYNAFSRKKLQFEFISKPKSYIGLFLILFGLLIYPVLEYFLNNNIITVGLPCPSAIITFGFFMLVISRFPRYLLVIPVIWALIGTTAAIKFGVYPDIMLFIAAVIASGYLLFTKKLS